MSKTEKTYCSLYTFIKRTNPDLYEILDDMCAVGLFRTRNDITFLNPSDKLTNQLIEMVEKDQSEEAFKHLKSLFIYGKHNSLSKDVVSYNNKKYGEDLSGLKQLSAFKQWKDSQNVSVFDYKSDKFPKEGENAERPPMNRSKGKGKKGRGIDDNAKVLYTAELMETKDYKKVIYVLNSLLKSLDDETLGKVKSKIDPNMILTWYIIVQPGKSKPDYIPHEIFNTWKESIESDSLPKNTDVLNKILENIKPSKLELMAIKRNRATASENSDSLEYCKNTIKSIYQNNMTKLLEDELRFRYSDECDIYMFNDYVSTLNTIKWDEPSDSLVLLKDLNSMNNPAVLHCLKQFIKSSAFDYTLLSDGMCEKLSNSISGAGSGKGKKMIKILGNKHREMFKNTKSVKTVEKIESLLSHLSAKERAHLKSMM